MVKDDFCIVLFMKMCSCSICIILNLETQYRVSMLND